MDSSIGPLVRTQRVQDVVATDASDAIDRQVRDLVASDTSVDLPPGTRAARGAGG